MLAVNKLPFGFLVLGQSYDFHIARNANDNSTCKADYEVCAFPAHSYTPKAGVSVLFSELANVTLLEYLYQYSQAIMACNFPKL